MIETSEIDGVPVLFAERTGPYVLGLTFRVGVADETLPTRGITHLVEHLALHRAGLTEAHYNGTTAAAYTDFLFQGSATGAAEFLADVCAALADLPVDRLETEKKVLRAESRGRHSPSPLPIWRYGAQGYGLPGYTEWGLSRLTAEAVLDWAATWFTSENAVLWISGERLPDNLRLPLPAGVRRPLPEAVSLIPTTPAYCTGADKAVLLHAPVSASPAGRLAAGVLDRELFRQLRQRGGYSYTATAGYEVHDHDHAVVHAVADSTPDTLAAVVGGFVDVLATLLVGPDPVLVETLRARHLEQLAEPGTDTARLPGAARLVLRGGTVQSLAELVEEFEDLTFEQVREACVELADAVLLQVPHGRGLDWAGYDEAPWFSPETASGPAFDSLDGDGGQLIIGPTAVSFATADGAVTIHYGRCAARLDWPDGARRLIGLDGEGIHIEPTLYEIPAATLQQLDDAIDPALVLPQPARDPDSIPKPAPKSAKPGPEGPRVSQARLARGRKQFRFNVAFVLVCAVLAVLSLGACLTGTNAWAGVIIGAAGGGIRAWYARNLHRWIKTHS